MTTASLRAYQALKGWGAVKERRCEDPECGEDAPLVERRIRCKACGLLVCGWCFGHVHILAHMKAEERNQTPQVHERTP